MDTVSGVRVGSVERVVFAQLRQFKSAVVQFTRRTLNMGGRAIRLRMVRERLNGRPYRWWKNSKGIGGEKPPPGAPLARKKGYLIRSIRMPVKDQGDSVVLNASIGDSRAWYAEQHENSGRLQFRRVVAEEAVKIQQNLQIGFSFLAKNPGFQYGSLSAGAISGDDLIDARGADDAGRYFKPTRFVAAGGHFGSRRLRDRGGRGNRNIGPSANPKHMKDGFWDKERQIPRSGFGAPTSFAGFTP